MCVYLTKSRFFQSNLRSVMLILTALIYASSYAFEKDGIEYDSYYDDANGNPRLIVMSINSVPADGIVTIPEEIAVTDGEINAIAKVTAIDRTASVKNGVVKKLVLSKAMTDIGTAPSIKDYRDYLWFSRLVQYGLEEVEVDKENPVLKCENGFLTSKDGKNLHYISKANREKSVLILPDGVEYFATYDYYYDPYFCQDVPEGEFVYGTGFNVGQKDVIVFPVEMKYLNPWMYYSYIIFKGSEAPESLQYAKTNGSDGDSLPGTIYLDNMGLVQKDPYIYIPFGSLDNYCNSTLFGEVALKGLVREADVKGEMNVKVVMDYENESWISDISINGKNCKEITVAPYELVSITIKGFGFEEPDYFWNSEIGVPGHSNYNICTEYDNDDGKWTITYWFMPVADTEIRFGRGGYVSDGFNFRRTWDGVELTGEEWDGRNKELPSNIVIGGEKIEVTAISEYAFSETYRQTIKLPQSVKRIKFGAFQGGMEWVEDEDNNITCIPKGNIKEVIFNDGLEVIDAEAFACNPGLTSVELPNSLVSLSGNAFRYTNIREGVVPPNVRYCDKPFEEANGGKSVERLVLAESDNWMYGHLGSAKTMEINRPWKYDDIFNGKIECDNMRINARTGQLNFSNIQFNGPSSMKSLSIKGGDFKLSGAIDQTDYALKDADMVNNLKEVDIDCNSLTLSTGTFVNCEHLEDAKIKVGSDGELQNCTFNNCNRLKSVVLEGLSGGLKIHTFAGCEALEKVTVPEGIRYICPTAFYETKGLKRLEFEDSASPIYIAESAFDDCNLEELRIGRNIVDFTPTFFRNKTLKKLEIGAEVSSLSDYAFADCTNLEEIWCDSQIPPVIGPSTFRNVANDKCKVFVKGDDGEYRQTVGWKEFFPISRVEEIVEEPIKIYSQGGNVCLNGTDGKRVAIYSLSGSELFYTPSGTEQEIINIPAGICIIIVGDKAIKYNHK